MVVGAASERPSKPPLGFGDRQIVDAGDPPLHIAVRVKFPVLVAIAARPIATAITALIGEPHRDAVVGERPKFLDEAILEFSRPLAREKGLNSRSSLHKLRTIAPAAAFRVGKGHFEGIPSVPGVLRHAHFLDRGLASKRRHRGSIHSRTPAGAVIKGSRTTI